MSMLGSSYHAIHGAIGFRLEKKIGITSGVTKIKKIHLFSRKYFIGTLFCIIIYKLQGGLNQVALNFF